jgi:hypothetical protein
MLSINVEHQVFGGIPTVHQNGAKRNFALTQTVEHIGHMIEFGFAITVGVVDAVVQHPAAPTPRVNIQARHQTDAVDHLVPLMTLCSLPLHCLGVISMQGPNCLSQTVSSNTM